MSDEKRDGDSAKISTGPNDRPRDESIAQTAGGLPDDSSRTVEVETDEAERIEERLRAGGGERQ
ncbi:hypothetical protein [Mangrovibrevibacter kandeliae]|uniref:hypothetical protein n=1 Tax=Mangrovibrevibacter kandeliae TaxID=2968473 RepID=UPI0021192CAB|nr:MULTISPECIES: hypothetical protein [unclassified Aurantimonas]MCQ8783983.1 hypothetical protein [Aurantimonas sp. CSK15Z-1]MCW4116700.1 hypothetical protein [Aurantimonas sp. MSK8Z-1]